MPDVQSCSVVFSVSGLNPEPCRDFPDLPSTCREARLSTVLAPFWVEEIAAPVIKAEAGLRSEMGIDFHV